MKRFVTGSMMLVVVLVALAALIPAETAGAKGEDVTFHNRSTRTQHLVVAFGGETCGEMSEKETFSLEPKESKMVQSGSSKVCYCVSPVGGMNDCGDFWKKSKPGRKVEIR